MILLKSVFQCKYKLVNDSDISNLNNVHLQDRLIHGYRWLHLRGAALFQLAPFVEILSLCTWSMITFCTVLRERSFTCKGHTWDEERKLSSRLRGHLTFENGFRRTDMKTRVEQQSRFQISDEYLPPLFQCRKDKQVECGIEN